MNLPQAKQYCKEHNDLNPGYIWVNDDKELFWSNERPTRYDGFWGCNSRTFIQLYLGKFTGNDNWQETLREIM